MNILFIYGNGVLPHIGGIANITLSLAEMFRNEGHQVWYLGLLKCETCSYDENQLFFPTCEDGKENFDYLFNICKNNIFQPISFQKEKKNYTVAGKL